MKLIIGNRAYSSWSMRGWLALKQSELEFEELVVPLFDEAWEAEAMERVKQAINDATDFAEKAPLPDGATFARHVYAERES